MKIYLAGPIFFYGDYLRNIEWANKIREAFPDVDLYSPVENTKINGVEGKKKFAGSFFGVIWMFVQPMATVLVYTLIFQVGFRAVPPVPDVPYVVWLIAGIVPWFYFQETII